MARAGTSIAVRPASGRAGRPAAPGAALGRVRYMPGVVAQDPAGELLLRKEGQERLIDIPGRSDLYVAALEAFASAVSGDGPALCTGEDGLHSHAIAIAAPTSAEVGRTVSLAEILHNSDR